MYTRNDYKTQIKKLILDKGYDPVLISSFTYDIYMDHIRELDKEFKNAILDIVNMEMGPEFEMTEKEFMDFLEKM